MSTKKLVVAIGHGDVQSVTRCLNDGCDIEARDEKFNATPLCHAAFHCQLEVVRLLVDQAANPLYSEAVCPFGRTPLELAYSARFFNSKASISASDAGVKMLRQAMRESSLSRSNDPINAMSGADQVHLVDAARHGQLDLVRALLDLETPSSTRGPT